MMAKLIEAKVRNATNAIIGQLYYPFHQRRHAPKPESTLLSLRTDTGEYHLWHFSFGDPQDYDSIRLLRSARYQINLPNG